MLISLQEPDIPSVVLSQPDSGSVQVPEDEGPPSPCQVVCVCGGGSGSVIRDTQETVWCWGWKLDLVNA